MRNNVLYVTLTKITGALALARLDTDEFVVATVRIPLYRDVKPTDSATQELEALGWAIVGEWEEVTPTRWVALMNVKEE